MKGNNAGSLDKSHPSSEERIRNLVTAIQEEGLEENNANAFPKRFSEIKTLVR